MTVTIREPFSDNRRMSFHLLCVVAGHRWQVDDSTTATEAVLRCARCGHAQLAPNATGFDNRVNAKTGADRAVGPFGPRR